MKWENRDTNIVKEAKIPNFNKLDDIGMLLRHFQLFFDDALVDMFVGYTKWYDHRKKANTSFENL